LTKLAGNRYVGCYVLAVIIFGLGLGRDYVYSLALDRQPAVAELTHPFVQLVARALFTAGLVFVLSSYWRLGITGTFLGDYFGILMSSKVEGFPFNLLSHPMYTGSTMMFLAGALFKQSAAGIVLSLHAWVLYLIAATFFEGPFTSYIYSQKQSRPIDRKKKRST